MKKLRLQTILFLLFAWPMAAGAQYVLRIIPVDRNDSFIRDSLKLQSNFKDRQKCEEYVRKIPAILQQRGYPVVSVDSERYDSTEATIELYVGASLRWAYLNTDSIDKRILDAVAWNRKDFEYKRIDMLKVQELQEKILDHLENSGYPFAKVLLDSIGLQGEEFSAMLRVEKGPMYKIDSIRNNGKANLSSNYLQHYLGILNGSIYQKKKLQLISQRLRELPFVEEERPWDLTLLGEGSILNVYLKPKKSSQVNVLIGLLPDNNNNGAAQSSKLLVTGEATVNLKNALGGGELIGLNWQQIQPKSPRLNLAFQQPYLFNSPFGMNAAFDLFKKDSSFLNISFLLGAQYAVSTGNTGSVFIQNTRSNLLTVDTNAVKNEKKLPPEADVSAVNLGVNYEWYNTDYRFNPRKGTDLFISASAGTRKIRKNNVIVKLKDQSNPEFDYNSLYDTFQLNSYQFRVKAVASQYFKLTRVSTLKMAFNGGWFQSPDIFRNELFQIGGYKLLRGFDEESIYASSYAVGTSEYRYLLGQNSFLFAFIDFGWARSDSRNIKVNNTFLGTGIGMAFETKAGIFNISYAVGKRDDTKFNLRQAKIHLGYVNYF
ncbi:ShlB/FhaC/HecB family hemolysin secretion/activation protein [Pseudoflavitalea rhizosphaerae]|uniref:ShlB/FhaC/HecB family hemolysin secretion/activation protein n=1 Tax=Pseudoflavitalea rhizosphaerae TaxID=1884793 RepID=UPI000F8F0AEF|nr:ShlB/FhaC/HecB family hemolysin secretion/activation protein [Pseudoflavitalea rhizosphaerae]